MYELSPVNRSSEKGALRKKVDGQKKRTSIGKKMYLFVFTTVLFVALAVCTISYSINSGQIDRYFKRLTINSADNFASFVDVEFLKELRAVAESEEYQRLRDVAEETEDETLVEDYLKEKGLWERYEEHRSLLTRYLRKMKDIKYLYIVVWGSAEDMKDMYLLDDLTIPVYETGYYEDREPEFAGTDPTREIEPVISNGDWGWLCSGFAPVFDENGKLICHVGCDVGMEDIMRERRMNLTYTLISAMACAVLVLAVAVLIVSRSVIKPLHAMTREMKKFSPDANCGIEEAGVINLDIRTRDEIQDIYEEIRSMQIRIIDYIRDIMAIERDKKKAEDDIRSKDLEIGKISREAYKDALTGIGNKNAYDKKIAEMNAEREHGELEYAIVMMDVNCLKMINDNYGHSAGDTYLRGCCRTICEHFKHSPVFRIGGDEFIAILCGDDYLEREKKVRELRDTFEKSFHNEKAEPWFRYSASVGMAERVSKDETVEMVFKHADKLMYEQKLLFKKQNGIATDIRV